MITSLLINAFAKNLNQYFDAQVSSEYAAFTVYFTGKISKMAATYALRYIAGFRRIKFLPTSNNAKI